MLLEQLLALETGCGQATAGLEWRILPSAASCLNVRRAGAWGSAVCRKRRGRKCDTFISGAKNVEELGVHQNLTGGKELELCLL